MDENRLGMMEGRFADIIWHQRQSEQFVSDTFGGSLPAFIATFTKGKTLSDEEADEIQRLIDKSRSKNRQSSKKESSSPTRSAEHPSAHADIFPLDARVHQSEEERQ